jgi:4-hydroxy-tetrahydrodipicolinate synthase
MKNDFSGVVGAPVTPFDKNNRVDYDTFAKQVNFLINNGASVIAHPMHIGESINMTIEERKELADALRSGCGRFHVHPAPCVNRSVGRPRRAEGRRDEIVLAPYYWRPNRDAIIDHFMPCGRPDGKLIIYNNVKATNVEISPDILTELFDRLPNFVGLKDASFQMEYFTEICRLNAATGKNIAIYTGVEYLLTSMPVGGRGCFSACSEVAPRLVLSLYKACAAMDDVEKARSLQYKVRLLLSLLMQNYPATIKYAMELMGRPVGETRKPILPIPQRPSEGDAEIPRCPGGRAPRVVEGPHRG